ncbi:hypothetical protein [Paenibacillus hamazuiensis]|uniref:hypothetical protein n=1 Tax=Paenibacillus hamazuiensis TaxID=2936508 RepID=UPI00200DDBE5|nr:hypothetical protein [Paenibacillus hamazuiensis]
MYLYRGLTLSISNHFEHLQNPAPFRNDKEIDYVPLLDILRFIGASFEWDPVDRVARISLEEGFNHTSSVSENTVSSPYPLSNEIEEIRMEIFRDSYKMMLFHPLYTWKGSLFIALSDLPKMIPLRHSYNHWDDYIVLDFSSTS